MVILIWLVVCVIFYLVQKILGDSGHALELFALLTALALFFINRLIKLVPINPSPPVTIIFFIIIIIFLHY